MKIKIKDIEEVSEIGDAAFTRVKEDGVSREAVLVVLPCGHNALLRMLWTFENYGTDKLTVSPSIFCSPKVPCWHGWLQNGELKSV